MTAANSSSSAASTASAHTPTATTTATRPTPPPANCAYALGIPGLELAAFVDVGAAKNLLTDEIDHLAGWGVGLRYSKPNDWYAQFDFARKINGRPDRSEPGDDDCRLWFQVYKMF